MIYREKLIQSGNVIEVVKYGVYIRTGDDKRPSLSPPLEPENFGHEKEDSRSRSMNRAKHTLRRKINCNANAWGVPPKFVTLTFAEHITDIDIAHYEFEKFMKRLNYYEGNSKKSYLKYTCVIEFTKKGRIHYHVIFYNLQYIKNETLRSIWTNGFIKINRIKQVTNVGAYVTKYMSKDNDDPRLKKRKTHFGSRGLKKPRETVNELDIEEFKKQFEENKTFEKEYETDFTGRVNYKQYII